MGKIIFIGCTLLIIVTLYVLIRYAIEVHKDRKRSRKLHELHEFMVDINERAEK